MEKEIRNIANQITRGSEDSRLVEGVAVVFNSDSQDMGFIERISPNAITQETIDNSDIFVYLDHDQARGVLARSRYGIGSLTLSLAEDGLHYSFEAPKTALGDELLSYLERGEINTSSFAFSLPQEGGDKWYRDENNVLHRDIIKIERLYDCSPVFEPAYLATSVSHRKLDDIKANDEKLDLLKKEIDLL
ncbi:MAG: HK97 family phage prohead protease [Lachnospiraceae bacterium]|nr:HK97 family phage prohead protease [Lachnospiraceae bacterium]